MRIEGLQGGDGEVAGNEPGRGNFHNITKKHLATTAVPISLHARLRSIRKDGTFVAHVARAARLPLVANERCGGWYVRPELKAGSAYFKSTDGHRGQWSFNLRRLNLHILDIVGESGGCIIVDSTRRKPMSDALSKTVPIWITVINRLLFPEAAVALRTPPVIVGDEEHNAIVNRLGTFIASAESLELDIESLRSKLKGKPMQPCWITPESDFAVLPPLNDDYHAVLLCTASSNAYRDDDSYIPGAADDQDYWAHGLSPLVFWQRIDEILSKSEEELPAVISELMLASEKRPGSIAMQTTDPQFSNTTLILPTSSIFIADNTAAHSLCNDFDLVIMCGQQRSAALADAIKDRYIHFVCGSGKDGSRQLRSELINLLKKDSPLAKLSGSSVKIVVADPDGTDLAVGLALALLCLLCDDLGVLQPLRLEKARDTTVPLYNKALIKRRLSWIMMSMPHATPSRKTLLAVNSFLMSGQYIPNGLSHKRTEV